MVNKIKAKKDFVVVVYDIADDKRRNRVVKVLEQIGIRVNYSVFECCVTEAVLKKTKHRLSTLINLQEDTVIFYPICVNCFCKIEYLPDNRKPHKVVEIV